MAGIETQILSWFYGLTALATLETIALVLAKRHVQKGLKIWFFRKFKKNPVQIVYVGPDNNVEEHIVLAKGEYVVAGNKVFNVQPERIKMSADNVPQLFYNWQSCVPVNFGDAEHARELGEAGVPDAPELQEKKKGLNRLRLELKGKVVQFLGKSVDGLSEEFFGELGAVFEPIDPQTIDVQTSPEALNKFMELVDIEAKKNADQSIQKWEKWLKYGFFGLLGVAVLCFFTYNVVNGTLKPQMEQAIKLLENIYQLLQQLAAHSNIAPAAAQNSSITV